MKEFKNLIPGAIALALLMTLDIIDDNLAWYIGAVLGVIFVIDLFFFIKNLFNKKGNK